MTLVKSIKEKKLKMAKLFITTNIKESLNPKKKIFSSFRVYISVEEWSETMLNDTERVCLNNLLAPFSDRNFSGDVRRKNFIELESLSENIKKLINLKYYQFVCFFPDSFLDWSWLENEDELDDEEFVQFKDSLKKYAEIQLSKISTYKYQNERARLCLSAYDSLVRLGNNNFGLKWE